MHLWRKKVRTKSLNLPPFRYTTPFLDGCKANTRYAHCPRFHFYDAFDDDGLDWSKGWWSGHSCCWPKHSRLTLNNILRYQGSDARGRLAAVRTTWATSPTLSRQDKLGWTKSTQENTYQSSHSGLLHSYGVPHQLCRRRLMLPLSRYLLWIPAVLSLLSCPLATL